MTDKVQKIREEVEKLHGNPYYMMAVKDVLEILDMQEEPVSEVWHDARKEPNDMGHCLIFYGCKESVGHYLHYEPVLYNKREKMFVTSSFPHPTGYKVEQKSFDGGCVAEVYQYRRDRISISDITQWCYLSDLHKLSNVDKIGKDWKEKPVSEGLENIAENYAYNKAPSIGAENTEIVEAFKAGAQWQKEQFEKDYTNLCNGIATVKGLAVAMTYNKGVADTKEQMMKNIWKDAQGDDLPEYEREVVVFTQNFPHNAGMMMVAIGHRPTPEGYDGKSLTTGEIKHYTPKTYDKGGWNIPDVKYWLDVVLPKEIEL